MAEDPRLLPSADVWFDAGGDRERMVLTVADARLFVGEEYFRDLADIYEPITQKSRYSADVGVVDHLRYPEPLPVHVRRLTARYAADIEPGIYEGARDGANVSSLESELCFPLGTVIAIEDKVRVRGTYGRVDRWFTIRTADDPGTDALMLVCRGVSIGVPDGIVDA